MASDSSLWFVGLTLWGTVVNGGGTMKEDCDVEHTVEESGLDRKNEEEREEEKEGQPQAVIAPSRACG